MKPKDTGHVFDTADGIALYRLAAMKAKIRLERDGIRTGKSARVLMAAELGLKARDSYGVFLDALQVRIDALKKKILKERLVVEERGTDYALMCCDKSALVMQDLNCITHDAYMVFYYSANVQGDAKPREKFFDLAQAMDSAESWLLEVK
jgi:hypothetical protein